MRSTTIVVLGLAVVVSGCRGRRTAPASGHDRDAVAASAQDVLNAQGLYVTTASESAARVRRAFPDGVASEDVRSLVGTAPPPPSDRGPDPRSTIVVEVAPSSPIDVGTIRAATSGSGNKAPSIEGMLADGAWQFVADQGATGPYTRLAAAIEFVDVDAPVSPEQVERQIRWARAALGDLGKRPATASMTAAQAYAAATTAVRLSETLTDVDVGIMIVAPAGKKFAGRLVWDVAYSAGFTWGDGDYFHWVPTADTDISQGIGMGATSGPGYFVPEWITNNDGSADVAGLEMSFSVPRTWKPAAVFDVMVRAATYMARRLGGTAVTRDGAPFDETRERARVTAIVKAMDAADLVPGSGLALRVF